MILLSEYFGKWFGCADMTDTRLDNAEKLLDACNDLELMARNDGIKFQINPHTGSQVSGDTLGGFRPQTCGIGAIRSAHKDGLAVDIYDPDGAIDEWCLHNLDRLEKCGIYIEDPLSTNGWSHWTIRSPGSKTRVFKP